MSTLTIGSGTGARPVAVPASRPVRSAGPVRPVRAGRPVAAPSPAPLRLTRRGRLVVRAAVTLVVLALVAAAVLLVGGTAKADAAAHPLGVGYHVVQPGETLWQIAGEIAPRADRRDTVLRITELNALPSGAVVAGQRLAVPTGD